MRMSKRLVPGSIWKSIIPTAALAGLAAGTLLYSAAPADAKSQCLTKHQSCESRCAKRYGDFLPCIYRTCNKQYDNCVSGGKTR
jgi:hypothetical protein